MNIKNERKKHNFTQKEIANLLGIAQTSYSNYENGFEPNIETLKKLADIYKTSIDYLVGREETFFLYLTKLNQDERDIIEKLKHLNVKQKNRVNLYIDEMIRLQNEMEQEQKRNARD